MVVILLKLGMSFLEHAGGCTQPKSFFSPPGSKMFNSTPLQKKNSPKLAKVQVIGITSIDRYILVALRLKTYNGQGA